MQLNGKVAVITRGLSEIGQALAKGFLIQGAIVVIADTDESSLFKKAMEIGAIAVPADATIKSEIKKLVDKTTLQFGRIDLFVSNISFAELGDHYLSEKNWNYSSQSDVMAQMYATKYVLPHMIERKNGYLLNIMPAQGMLAEFHSGKYTTLKHPCLSFSERMATIYRHLGIKVSVLCSDSFITKFYDGCSTHHCETNKLESIADLVVTGIQEEKFMISSDEKKATLYQSKSQVFEMDRAIRA